MWVKTKNTINLQIHFRGPSPPNQFTKTKLCASVEAVSLRIRFCVFYFQPGSKLLGVQLRLQHSNLPNQKYTSPNHSCAEQNRSKPSKYARKCRERVASLGRAGPQRSLGSTYGAFCFLATEEKPPSTRSSGAAIEAPRSTQNINRTPAILSCDGNAQRRLCLHVSV